jgi:hypothetical protein
MTAALAKKTAHAVNIEPIILRLASHQAVPTWFHLAGSS